MPSTLAQKLNLKPDVVLEVTNIPANWMDQLGRELSSNPVTFATSDKPAARLIFVMNRDQVDELVFPVIKGIPPACVFWIAYPKGTSGVETDINRDILWKLIEPMGWGPARMIALDEVWSCMRFTPSKGMK